jgi:hypothetical protein
MPNSWKGMIAGFFATVVLSAVIVVFNSLGILPQLDIVSHIDRLGSIQRIAAWVDHFIVGVLLWGPIFAGLDESITDRPRWQKGLIFGAGAWLAMMLVFMPVVGGGLFGWRFGLVEPVGMLVLHLVYGLAIAAAYDQLDRRYPAKRLMPAQVAAGH